MQPARSLLSHTEDCAVGEAGWDNAEWVVKFAHTGLMRRMRCVDNSGEANTNRGVSVVLNTACGKARRTPIEEAAQMRFDHLLVGGRACASLRAASNLLSNLPTDPGPDASPWPSA